MRKLEDWQLEFEWLQVRHMIKDSMNYDKLPEMNIVLLLIGIQELGRVRQDFTKEEKQDLMHIAICRLLSYEGYYEFIGRDADGWPHWKAIRHVPTDGVAAQGKQLQRLIVHYFEENK